MHLVVAGSFTCYWDHDWAYFFLLMIGKYLLGLRGFLLCIFIRLFISYNNISTALILLYFCNKKMHMLMLLCTAVACLFGLLVLLGLRGYI